MSTHKKSARKKVRRRAAGGIARRSASGTRHRRTTGAISAAVPVRPLSPLPRDISAVYSGARRRAAVREERAVHDECVAVKPTLLRWARERAGLEAAVLEKSFPQFAQWERGVAQPTFKQLQAFAKKTHAPMGYLFLDTPPPDDYPIPHFSTHGRGAKKPSVNMLHTIYRMQIRQGCAREYLVDDGAEPLPIAGCLRREEPVMVDRVAEEQIEFASARQKSFAVAAAEKVRTVLGLPEMWARRHRKWGEALFALRNCMDDAGIFVVTDGTVDGNTHRALDADEFRGFVLADKYAPFVFINNTDSKATQMFTLAHALAHVAYGISASFDLAEMKPAKDAGEEKCAAAAWEFLLPRAHLQSLQIAARAEMPFHLSFAARRFAVSEVVLARRMLDCGKIARARFEKVYARYAGKNRPRYEVFEECGTAEDKRFRNENLRVGKRFARALIRDVHEGGTQYTHAYRMTGLWGRHFEEYAAYLGLGFGGGDVRS